MSANKKGKTVKYKAMISETRRLFDISRKFWTLEIIQKGVPYKEQKPIFASAYKTHKNAEKAAKRELAKWNGE
tara:strand:- start:164 stop:382 length:219 start_codon:yes stop_codon:yes gene_type:complete